MSDQSLVNDMATGAADDTSVNQAAATKTYTQEEFDRHMAGLKSSLAKKYEKTFAELGDIEELRQLKAQAESKKLEDAKKRGDFEKVLQDLAAKKDAEIQRRDTIIMEYKVNTPLLSAAAKYRAVNAEQVKTLLQNSVRLNSEGEVEVIDAKGTVRYTDSGSALSVDDLVSEFLKQNPHFVQSTPATTNTKTNIQPMTQSGKFDLSKLDLTRPQDRQAYKEARQKGLI